jgi:Adenylate and Guanylate cyclase catalytic domain
MDVSMERSLPDQLCLATLRSAKKMRRIRRSTGKSKVFARGADQTLTPLNPEISGGALGVSRRSCTQFLHQVQMCCFLLLRQREDDQISVRVIASGKVVFEVRNAGKLPLVFGILQLPAATFQRPKLRFMPSLSGKRLLMTQTFRDFFRSEVIGATEGIALLDVTLVFTDLKGSTALYERIGDLNAYIQVQRHFQHLLDVTVRHNGAVIKTIGDAVMAAFLTSADAVQAALEMREAVDQLNRDRPQRDFILKIGVHRGASIAVTLNERLDCFGQR